jgi:hypothetical protein
MSLDIGDALRSGVDDLLSETGVLVGGVVLLYSLGALVANETLGDALLTLMFESGVYSTAQQEAIQSFGGGTPFSLGVGLAIAAALAVVVTALGELVRFWAIRQFAGPGETKLPASDRAAMALLLGGTVAVLLLFFQQVLPIAGQLGGTALGIVGSIVGPIGGLVLLTVFVYLRQEIALGEGGVLATLRRSFARFMDDPVSIIVLMVVLGIAGFAASVPTFAIGFLGGSSSVGGLSLTVISRLLSTLLGVVFQTLGIAVVTDAYLQVRASSESSL